MTADDVARLRQAANVNPELSMVVSSWTVLALCNLVDGLRAQLDEAQLGLIEARNPGIDMEEVKRRRAEQQ